MALWECAECTAKYSVGAERCPQCGSTVRINEATQPDEQEETSMPKITVHGGPSIEGAEVDPDNGDVTPLAETDEDTTADESTPDAEAQNERRPRRTRKTTTE